VVFPTFLPCARSSPPPRARIFLFWISRFYLVFFLLLRSPPTDCRGRFVPPKFFVVPGHVVALFWPTVLLWFRRFFCFPFEGSGFVPGESFLGGAFRPFFFSFGATYDPTWCYQALRATRPALEYGHSVIPWSSCSWICSRSLCFHSFVKGKFSFMKPTSTCYEAHPC